MYWTNEYTESQWRDEHDARERDERRREARDLSDWAEAVWAKQDELPAIMRDDAGPIGMSCEDELEQARRRAPIAETRTRRVA
jgi:hypothetical protein